MNLSDKMRAAMRAIVREYDDAIVFERRQWGEVGAARIADRGINVAEYDRRTVSALESRGMIVARRVTHEGSVPRKGSFGRLVGGSRVHHVTNVCAKPTELGRDAVK